jgi:hypothetical protein
MFLLINIANLRKNMNVILCILENTLEGRICFEARFSGCSFTFKLFRFYFQLILYFYGDEIFWMLIH